MFRKRRLSEEMDKLAEKNGSWNIIIKRRCLSEDENVYGVSKSALSIVNV